MRGTTAASRHGSTLKATVTPLASIFGSGFLILVPTLERGLGGAAVIGMAIVLLVAWFAGTAIRHNMRVVEALEERGELSRTTHGLERASDAAIVVAYVISVTLYLRILSQHVLEFAGIQGQDAQQWMTMAIIIGIGAIGVVRGFDGLDWLDRIALAGTFTLVAILLALFLASDARNALDGTLELPPIRGDTTLHLAMLLGGILITVQGFETTRYLRDEFDRATRIAAARRSQVVAAVTYLVFVAVATPLMSITDGGSPDATLLDLTERFAAVLGLPLVVIAVLSQFSASVADTVAAVGNMEGFGLRALGGAAPFLVSTVAAVGLNWVISLTALVAVASRAFAVYYALQAVVAAHTADAAWKKAAFGALAILMTLIALFAKPVG